MRESINSLADDVVFITWQKEMCKNVERDVHAVRKGLTDNEIELSSDIMGVEVDLVLCDEMENQHC